MERSSIFDSASHDAWAEWIAVREIFGGEGGLKPLDMRALQEKVSKVHLHYEFLSFEEKEDFLGNAVLKGLRAGEPVLEEFARARQFCSSYKTLKMLAQSFEAGLSKFSRIFEVKDCFQNALAGGWKMWQILSMVCERETHPETDQRVDFIAMSKKRNLFHSQLAGRLGRVQDELSRHPEEEFRTSIVHLMEQSNYQDWIQVLVVRDELANRSIEIEEKRKIWRRLDRKNEHLSQTIFGAPSPEPKKPSRTVKFLSLFSI